MDSVLSQYGLAGLVITVLASATLFMFKKYEGVLKEKDDIQNQRLLDAKETRQTLMEPLQKQADLSEKIYDLLVTLNSSRRGK